MSEDTSGTILGVLHEIAGTLAGASVLTTKGDIPVHDGTAPQRLAVGSNTQVLTADSAQTLGVKWATPTAPGLTVRHLAGAGPYTVLATDDVVILPLTPTTSGTITLPATSTLPADKVIWIKVRNRNALTVRVARDASDTAGIDDGNFFTFSGDYQAVALASDKTGLAWWAVATQGLT